MQSLARNDRERYFEFPGVSMNVTFGRTLCLFGFLLIASNALAQNHKAMATYGVVSLSNGFDNDPITFDVTAGGEVNVRTELDLPHACEGFIHAGAPDLSVRYEAGEYPFQIYVQAQSDTTLVIRDPNGNWACDDDSLGVNPAKKFVHPTSGQYDIWVGTFDPHRVRAMVHLTEK